MRTRRRGVPRYNDFRAGLHKPRIARFEELGAEPGGPCAGSGRSTGNIDDVDTMVGLFAETAAGRVSASATRRSGSSS